MGATTAAGSITTMKNVLNASSESKNSCPNNDEDCFFDNKQRVGKTTFVRAEAFAPVNVATNVVYIRSENPSNIQSNETLKPTFWKKSFL